MYFCPLYTLFYLIFRKRMNTNQHWIQQKIAFLHLRTLKIKFILHVGDFLIPIVLTWTILLFGSFKCIFFSYGQYILKRMSNNKTKDPILFYHQFTTEKVMGTIKLNIVSTFWLWINFFQVRLICLLKNYTILFFNR